MPKKSLLIPIIASLSTLVMLPVAFPQQTKSLSFLLAQAQSPENLRQIAKNVTVRVYIDDNSGSGVLVAKNGQTYTVVTNAHVVRYSKTYRIKTPDGVMHQATLKTSEDTITGQDLALLQFESPKNYNPVTLASDSNLQPEQTVVAAGFPYDSEQISITDGAISLITEKLIKGGYQIGFSNPTRQGMSGGALLNENGQLIGILGKGIAILDTAYDYEDGTSPDEATLQQMQQANFAIPVDSVNFLTKLYTEQDITVTIPRQVNQIAEKVTVRVDLPDDRDASGVIIGKNGQTYYVLTASHVIGYGQSTDFKIVTPDGKSYTPKKEGIKAFEGLDLAMIEFTSPKTYSVATLADYPVGGFNIKRTLGETELYYQTSLVFLSGFPNRVPSHSSRKLTVGVATPRIVNFWRTKDQYSLLSGTELVYSNLSVPGMSGGGVFDHEGRLIGINTGAEIGEIGQDDNNKEWIAVGNSLGIPINTFLGQLSRYNLNTQGFQVETQAPTPLTKNQQDQILLSLSPPKKPTESSSAAQWFSYGRFYGSFGQYDQANQAYNQAIAKDPQFYQAYYAKGQNHLFHAQYQEAEIAFAKTIELNPDFAPAWILQSATLRELKQYSEALASIDQALELAPQEPKSYQIRGYILNDMERIPEAFEALTEAIKLSPNAYSYLLRSGVKSPTGEQQERIADLSQVIALQPNYGLAYMARSGAFSMSSPGDMDFSIMKLSNPVDSSLQASLQDRIAGQLALQLALQDINQAIELGCNYDLSYSQKAGILWRLKNCQEAIKYYTKAINMTPQKEDKWLFLHNRVACYWELGEWDEALNDLNQIVALDPQNAESYYTRGSLYAVFGEPEHKKHKKAIADFTQAIQLAPNNPHYYNLRGTSYMSMGEVQKSISDFQKAEELFTSNIEKNPNDVFSYQFRSNVRYFLRNEQGAISDLQAAQKLVANDPSLTAEVMPISVNQEFQQKLRRSNAYYTQEIKANPNNPRLYFYRGTIERKQWDYQTALADFNRSITLDPTHAEAYYYRGLTYQAIQDYPNALADFNKALELNIFDDTIVYYYRGLVKQKMGNHQGAIEDFNVVIKRQPNSPLASTNQRESYIALKDYDKAIESLNQWQKIHPDNGYLYSLRGQLFIQKGDMQSALKDFDKAITLAPYLSEPYEYRGEIHYQQGNLEQALADLKVVVEKDKKRSDIYLKMAKIYQQKGDFQSALSQFQQAIKLNPQFGEIDTLNQLIAADPNSSVLYVLRGQSYSRKGELDAALKDYDQAITLEPKFTTAYLNKGSVYRKQNNIDKALETYNQAIKINPDNAALYFGKGVIYHRQGDEDQALANYKLALEKDENYTPALRNSSYIYYERGEVKLALKQIEKTQEITPSAGEAMLFLAVISYSQGVKADAFKMSKLVLFIAPQWAKSDTLKQYLWGDKLIAEAQKMMQDPEIVAVLKLQERL